MTESQERHTLLTAQHFGGAFVKALARAGLVADLRNRERIFQAFPEILGLYGPRGDFYSEDLG
jgi:hypothetical protein